MPKTKQEPARTQKTPQGYEIPVPTREAVSADLKRVARAPKPKM